MGPGRISDEGAGIPFGASAMAWEGNLEAGAVADALAGSGTREIFEFGAGTGKLAEPVLYTTNLLRALNAADASSDSLPAQATAMGQNVLTPASVFSYFSPAYRIPGLGVIAPEFQAVNASTALARANYAYKAVTNGLSANIVVNLANLTDIANNPANLVEAMNQAFFRGEIDPNVQTALLTAANASTNTTSRVRSVLYAAAASPQYQVKQ